MNAAPIVVVGRSTAGCAAARELRALGYDKDIVMIGADPDGSYSRPPLSKHVLDSDDGTSARWDLSDLRITELNSAATRLDPGRKTVALSDGTDVEYGTLVVATGADARRLARVGQAGELVVRTHDDARVLRSRLDAASSAIIVGAGFLGMEIASACVRRTIETTVVDVDPPLERVLGSFLAAAIEERLAENSGSMLRPAGPVTLSGSPVDGIVLPDRTALHADVVVSCVGEVPASDWLDGTGVADRDGVGIGEDCSTSVPDVFAAGDVTYFREPSRYPRRGPFWSNAVAQGRVAAASALGAAARCAPVDDYFWTEVLGLSIKAVGPLPLVGEPEIVTGSVDDGSALLRWTHPDGRKTLVAYGLRMSVGKLRALARAEQGQG
ncbi:NAD(P)/FAD-dependent oxidoreductase [Rhodococcoides fascians]|uniref:NAD(P)/FAD-dependent oxidoreductase n=1 Tax=Rhodococcoides fascians TaxID=1828 RepID=UPI0005658061|nr:NAD(P)/FAD-dependent oxidoreductase [Rhodococcus fascians]